MPFFISSLFINWNMKSTSSLIVMLCILSLPESAGAQNEVLREINSLYGIRSFGVAVNVEKPLSLDHMEFRIQPIQNALVKKLAQLPIEGIADEELQDSDQYPMLILHINIMDAGNGTYPYATDLTFYQPVKLSLNRDLGTMAATWQTALVGIVSADNMQVIPNTSIALTDEFIQDYLKANL